MWLIRKVKKEDSELIFSWRNSPEVYKFLFNSAPIERSAHEEWLRKTLVNEKIAFYILEYDGRPVGTVRFDFDLEFKSAEVGIYLAPDEHGKGLGGQMLEVGERKVREDFPQVKTIVAKVIPENIASEKMFLKSGFSKKFIQLEKRYESN